jgi:hypothetical protein
MNPSQVFEGYQSARASPRPWRRDRLNFTLTELALRAFQAQGCLANLRLFDSDSSSSVGLNAEDIALCLSQRVEY